MISEQELRIGNWVSIAGVEIKLSVQALARIFEQDGDSTRCEPILLTEDWMVRFEFESVDDKVYSIKPRLSICPDAYIIRTGNVWKIQLGNETLSMPHVKYVHQLQNLYFALTGAEIKHIADATV